jgi:hypothetical protein
MDELPTSAANIFFKKPYDRALHLIGASHRVKRRYLSAEQGWPRHLYKYKPCNIMHLRSFIVDSLLYLSARSELNDPFDVQSVLKFVNGGPFPTSYHKHLFNEHGSRLKKRKEVQKRLSSPQSIQKGIRKHFDEAIDATGFHSFTTKPRDLLMWSHYADAHRGVCLIFSTAKDLDSFITALPITYTEAYPVIEYHEGIGGDLVEKAFLTKAMPWKYEHERRIFCPNLAKKFLRINPHSLSGLILGAKISIDDEVAVRTLVKERVARGLPSLKIYRANQSKNEYKIRILLDENQ